MIFTTRMNAMMVVIFINFSSTNPDNDEYAAYHAIMIIVIVIVISVIFTLSFAFRTDRASTTPSRTQPAHRYSLMVICNDGHDHDDNMDDRDRDHDNYWNKTSSNVKQISLLIFLQKIVIVKIKL